MFLHRLARAFGVIDIDALDDAITDEQLLEYQAAAWIDGWYHGRTPTADVVAEIRNLGSRLIVFQSSNPKQAAKEVDWVSGYDIIERQTKLKPKKSSTMMTPDQYLKHLEARAKRDR